MLTRLPLTLVLKTNALTSGLTGILLAALANPLSGLLGLSSTFLLVAGLGLVPFALFVWFVANDPTPARVRMVSAMDFAWVLGSIAVVIELPLTTLGTVAVLGVAAVVETFGTLQLLRLPKGGRILAAS